MGKGTEYQEKKRERRPMQYGRTDEAERSLEREVMCMNEFRPPFADSHGSIPLSHQL